MAFLWNRPLFFGPLFFEEYALDPKQDMYSTDYVVDTGGNMVKTTLGLATTMLAGAAFNLGTGGLLTVGLAAGVGLNYIDDTFGISEQVKEYYRPAEQMYIYILQEEV